MATCSICSRVRRCPRACTAPSSAMPKCIAWSRRSRRAVRRTTSKTCSKGRACRCRHLRASRRTSGGDEGGEQDALYDEAVKIVTTERKPSISYVQRRLKIGYNRAARLLEAMENAGVVGPLQPNGAREILAPAPPGSE